MLPSLSVIVLAVVTSVVASPAAEERVAGEWQLKNEIAGNTSEMKCSFTQKGTELTGVCVSELASVEIAGKVEETSVAWVYKSVYEGNPITLKYTGALGADGTIRGNVTVEEFSVTGDFLATPVKK